MFMKGASNYKKNLAIFDQDGSLLVLGPSTKQTRKAVWKLLEMNRDIFTLYAPPTDQEKWKDTATYGFEGRGKLTERQKTRMEMASEFLKRFFSTKELERIELKKFSILMAGPRLAYGYKNIQEEKWMKDYGSSSRELALCFVSGAIASWAVAKMVAHDISSKLSAEEVQNIVQKFMGVIKPYLADAYLLVMGGVVGVAAYLIAKFGGWCWNQWKVKMAEKAILTLKENDFTHQALSGIRQEDAK